eukprot:g24668.t1
MEQPTTQIPKRCKASGALPFFGVVEKLPVDLLIGWRVHYNDVYSAVTRAEDVESLPEGTHVVDIELDAQSASITTAAGGSSSLGKTSVG